MRLLCFVAGIAATAIIATVATRLLVPPAPSPWHELVWIKNVVLPIAMFALYAWLVRSMEDRPATELSLRLGRRNLLPGILIGSGIITCYVLLLAGLSMAHIAHSTGLQGLAAAVAIPLIMAMGEELLFRAITFRLLEEVFGSMVAVLLSAALFGIAHIANPGATPFTITALSVELGVMLALAYVLTRNIWFPIAIHAAWNFTQAFVFGLLNSGVRDPHTYFRTDLSGPGIITGGAFGPEGSVLTLLLAVAVVTALCLTIRRTEHWRPVRVQS